MVCCGTESTQAETCIWTYFLFGSVVCDWRICFWKFCSGSQTGRNLSRIHDRLSAQMDLWFTEESSEEFLQDGCIAGLRSWNFWHILTWWCHQLHWRRGLEGSDVFLPDAAMEKKLPVRWRLLLPARILHPIIFHWFRHRFIQVFLISCILLSFYILEGIKKSDGQVAAFYLIFYSIGRFVLEFFRGDLIRGSVGSLSTSQFISLFILAAGIAILITRTKKKKCIRF